MNPSDKFLNKFTKPQSLIDLKTAVSSSKEPIGEPKEVKRTSLINQKEPPNFPDPKREPNMSKSVTELLKENFVGNSEGSEKSFLERDKRNFEAAALNRTKNFSTDDSSIPEFSLGESKFKYSLGKKNRPKNEIIDFFSKQILLLASIIGELSIDSQIKRKDELENALFTLEKEHLNGLASDSSYYDIKSRIIRELGKIDEKLALIQEYSEINTNFKQAISDIEELSEALVSYAKKTEAPEKVEGTLSELTRKYFAGEIDEENYYDLKAKLNVKLNSF